MAKYLAALMVAVMLGASTPSWADESCRPDAVDPSLGCAPAGTLVTRPGDAPVALPDVRFLISRTQLDSARAAESEARALERRLAIVLAEAKPTPAWVTAAKWATIGLLIGGSFVAGLVVH